MRHLIILGFAAAAIAASAWLFTPASAFNPQICDAQPDSVHANQICKPDKNGNFNKPTSEGLVSYLLLRKLADMQN